MRPRVRLATGSPAEVVTKVSLDSLLDRLDLSRFLITDEVVIQDGVVPHSHPVLTLTTGYPHEAALLSSYIHEQMHWWSMACPGGKDGRDDIVLRDLGATLSLPLEPPDGSGDEISNLIHIHVCWLELEALAQLRGDAWAEERVLRIPHYRAIYAAAVEHRALLRSAFEEAEMNLPEPAL